jgi:hypothetical protein
VKTARLVHCGHQVEGAYFKHNLTIRLPKERDISRVSRIEPACSGRKRKRRIKEGAPLSAPSLRLSGKSYEACRMLVAD